MSNVPVDINAVFNVKGELRPRYVRLQDEDTKELYTYKIDVEYVKDENYAGIPSILFGCFIDRNGIQERIKIRYHKLTTQWVQIK